MTETLNTLAEQFQQNSLLELTAVVFAILYLLLAVRENIFCWAAAIVSTLIFLFIFWDVQLYMESGLQIYYIGMAQLPFLDSFTTWASVVTTFMVAKKVLENWIYWLVIDSVSIYLYLDRELYFTALLFAVYIVIIFFGWSSWLKSYQQRTVVA